MKIVSLIVKTLVALVVLFVITLAFLLIFSPFGSYVVPDASFYPGAVRFSSNNRPLGPLFFLFSSSRTYNRVFWDVPMDGPAQVCPISTTIDGKTWSHAELQWDAFLKTGAMDVTTKETTGKIATIFVPSSSVEILCNYSPEKVLFRVNIQHCDRPTWLPDPGTSTARKEFLVSYRQGTVTLPANHRMLVKALGKPEKYVPAARAYARHIF